MSDLLARLADQSLNRLSGTYAGFRPRRPRALVIPRFVAIERNVPSMLELLAGHLDMRQVHRPLVVADEITWALAGESLHRDLKAARLNPQHALVESNSYAEARRVLEAMSRPPRWWSREEAPWEQRLFGYKLPSVVFGVGGGMVVDMAKLVAFQLHVPCVTIPTSLGNDGIASPFAVIRPGLEGRPANLTVKTNTPHGVVVDLGIISPPDALDRPFFLQMMRSGIGDAVSNLTSTMDWMLAAREGHESLDYLAYHQARSAGEMVLNRLTNEVPLDDPDLVLTLAASLISSGEAMTRVGSSRPASGFEHKLYHAYQNVLRYPTRASHGVMVGVGTLASAALHGKWYEPVRAAFQHAGLPVDRAGLEALDLEPARIEEAIEVAATVKPERYTILEHLGTDAVVRGFRQVFNL